MCARNHNGGADREHLRLTEVTLEDFKQWFPVEFLSSLNHLYACGNYGDPIIAKDCLEILEYARSVNPKLTLGLNTNGSAKSKDWWTRLAAAIGTNGTVTFAVDGFKGQHELYRRGTHFDLIIENAKTFISAGGRAVVDSLVFAHNEETVDDLEKFLLGIGVEHVNFKSTKRFYNQEEFPVQNKDGEFDYNLVAAKTPRWKQEIRINVDALRSSEGMKKFTQNVIIEPECAVKSQVYVDCHGNLLPCCWIGSDFQEPITEEDGTAFTFAKNSMYRNSKSVLNDITVPNLKQQNIADVLAEKTLWAGLHEKWTSDDKPIECVKSCSTKLYDTLYKHTVKYDPT
jgi:MoaA/NifB/PqqE/SkfB family radical SAM enzyme